MMGSRGGGLEWGMGVEGSEEMNLNLTGMMSALE